MRKVDYKFCVYTHSIGDNVFYVGCGLPERPYIKGRKGKDRNEIWFNIVENNNYQYKIDIIMKSNNKKECLRLEEELTIQYKKNGMCKANIIYGNKHSSQSKNAISKARQGRFKGKENYFYGKKHTKETIELIKNKSLGRKSSEETNKKKANFGKNNPVSKEIVAVYGNKTKYYDTIRDLKSDIKCSNAAGYATGKLGAPPHY